MQAQSHNMQKQASFLALFSDHIKRFYFSFLITGICLLLFPLPTKAEEILSEPAWAFEPIATSINKIEIDSKGNIYCSNSQSFYCYTAQPKLLWQDKTSSLLTIDSKDLSYSWCEDKSILSCRDSTGKRLWKYRVDRSVKTVAPDPTGKVYILTANNTLSYFSPNTNELIWSKILDFEAIVAKAGPSDQVYILSKQGHLYCFHSKGDLIFSFKTEDPFHCFAITEEETLYCGSKNGFLSCLNRQGDLLEQYAIGAPITHIVLDKQGEIYANSSDNCLYCLDPINDLLWEFPTREVVMGIGIFDGTLYFHSDKRVYHIETAKCETSKWRKKNLESSPAFVAPLEEPIIDPLDILSDQIHNLESRLNQYADSIKEFEMQIPFLLPIVDKRTHEVQNITIQPIHPEETGSPFWAIAPLFDANNIVYFFSKEGTFYCLKHGELLWKQAGIPTDATFIAGQYGYFASIGCKIIRITPDRLHIHYCEKNNSPEDVLSIDANQSIYHLSSDLLLSYTPPYRIYPSWQHQLSYEPTTSPISDKEGNTYLTLQNRSLCCILPSGEFLWEITLPSTARSIFSTEEDNYLYLTTEDNQILCLNKEGSIVWNYQVERKSPNSGLVAKKEGNKIYITVNHSRLICLHREGKFLWQYAIPNGKTTFPTIDSQGNSYLGSDQGCLYCIDANGLLCWRIEIGEPILSPITISPDEKLFLVTKSGLLYTVQKDL